MSSANTTTTYFGYGSNLWKHQMVQRCPTSEYLGIAKLEGFKWIINSRGYANVVETGSNNSSTASATEKKNGTDVVWGLVYNLRPEDEHRLDINEGVPIAYTKENFTVSFWPARNGSTPDVSEKPEEREMLVYIDRVKTVPDQPKREYVYRMNQGIEDALAEGVPEEYVEGVMRKFIPEEEGEDDGVRGFAMRQAVMFEEED